MRTVPGSYTLVFYLAITVLRYRSVAGPQAGAGIGRVQLFYKVPTTAIKLTVSSHSSGVSATARVVLDPQGMGGTSHELQLQLANPCGSGSYDPLVAVPLAVGSAGPALGFDYRVTGSTKSAFNVATFGSAFVPTIDGDWHHGVVCMDPTTGDRPKHVDFTFQGTGSGSACALPSDQVAALDNLSTTTSTSCAAQ
jgi:hypothetical protein